MKNRESKFHSSEQLRQASEKLLEKQKLNIQKEKEALKI